MKCPNDGSTLVMTERSGVEIDYCPDCRGVWLDRGELDKIIDRADAGGAAPPAAPPYRAPAAGGYPEPPFGDRRGDDYRGDKYGGDPRRSGSYDGGYRRKKKDNWLSELFD